eukprot:m.33327 g.33327  ORF g.33327 m.33327 type:complete len:163 (-) comp12223_c0_seq1:649-1137(-)
MDTPSPTATFEVEQTGVEISSRSKGNIFFAFAALPVAIMGSVVLVLTIMRWYNRRQARQDSLRHSMSVSRYSVTVQPNDDAARTGDSNDAPTLHETSSLSTSVPATPSHDGLGGNSVCTSTPRLEMQQLAVQPPDEDYDCEPLLATTSGIVAMEEYGDNSRT